MSFKQRPIIGGEIAIDLIFLYAAYNQKYFKDKLPRAVPIFWCSKDKLDANSMATCFYTAPAIMVTEELKAFPCVAKFTLLHEMVHLRWPKAKHGKKFHKEMLRLAKIGAFKDLW